MDIDDKTRVVPSLAKKRKVEPGISSAGAQAPSDVTVFVGAKQSPQQPVQRPARDAAKSITSVDRTVFAQSGGTQPAETSRTNPPTSAKTLIKERFELVNLLGAGGMGAVYRALDRRKVEANDSDPYLAVKLLNDDFRQHPDAFISLQREARKSQNLAHPNIVTVYDFDRDGEIVFMTMEYLDGTPLDKLLRQSAGQGLDKLVALDILRDITAALMHAHSQHIVHSDFKPGNIFVTNKKGTKVFDFGIARAVAGGMQGSTGEKTLFDAGSLGALTPAYASLEMLKGDTPSESDDVYALGCVAYEMLSGRHPFNKLPADKARAQKLRPKRLKMLSRRQWRAIEGALQFERSQRLPDAKAFMTMFFSHSRALWVVSGVSLLSLAVLGTVLGLEYREQRQVDAAYKQQLELQLQQELRASRIADKQETLQRLLALASISVDWERNIRKELDEFEALSGDADFQQEIRDGVATKLLRASSEYLAAGELENGQRTLTRAEAWSRPDDPLYRSQKQQVEDEISVLEQKLAAEHQAELDRLAAEQRAIAREQAAREAREHAVKVEAIVAALERQLRCGFSLSVSDVGQSLGQMQALDREKALRLRPILAQELSACIQKLALENPRRVAPLLAEAQAFLPEQTALTAMRLDYCAHLQPGSGGRGERFSCVDDLSTGSEGPALVVVKDDTGLPLAITRYELTWQDLAGWCASQADCEPAGTGNLPATGLTPEQIQSYAAWLSERSGYQYRLPTLTEWFGAVSAKGDSEPADRNCYLKYGGIEKGGELQAAAVGKPNRFGLVNGVGNASELVQSGEGLLAAGGNYLDPMGSCLATTKVRFNGIADPLVGFRLVRNLSR